MIKSNVNFPDILQFEKQIKFDFLPVLIASIFRIIKKGSMVKKQHKITMLGYLIANVYLCPYFLRLLKKRQLTLDMI